MSDKLGVGRPIALDAVWVMHMSLFPLAGVSMLKSILNQYFYLSRIVDLVVLLLLKYC